MTNYKFAQFDFDANSGVLTVCSIQTNEQGEQCKVTLEYELGQEIQLRHKVANLLHYLLTHKDKIISKEELLSELWQHGDYRENSLTQSIRELRLALGDSAKNSSFVKTFPQRGYQWVCELSEQSITVDNDENKQQVQRVQEPTIAIKRGISSLKTWAAIALVTIVLLFWFNRSVLNETVITNEMRTSSSQQKATHSLIILPFINNTQDTRMAWLELGLADMLSIELQRASQSYKNNRLQFTSPAMANTLLLSTQTDWPAKSEQIQALLKQQNKDVALLAKVRLHNQQQVLDFQLIYQNGNHKQGSISYNSLPASVPSISRQLLHLLIPEEKLKQQRQQKNDVNIENPIAAQLLAQGMQALQTTGEKSAQKYFKAALILNRNDHWARAYLACSQYSLGQWREAEQVFSQIPDVALQQDVNLYALVSYHLSELAFRRGDKNFKEKLLLAIKQAEQANDINQMARSYRLKAQLAWQQMHWSEYKRWTEKSQRLFATDNDLSIEADRLFYLGNPTADGLEKNPDNDLKKNKLNLTKALNFYQQLGNKKMIAASHFAIAKNYSFATHEREQALTATINAYKALALPYELAQAYNYAGFYQMQLHEGGIASTYFKQAQDIAIKLASKSLLWRSDFYLAFSTLDQGLDQRQIGKHGKNELILTKAVELLNASLLSDTSLANRADVLVFLGWANTGLGNDELALKQLSEAKQLNKQLSRLTTYGYSSYSMMRIYLAQADYQAVIDLANDKITTRLQATYLARAYFELGNTSAAIKVLKSFKEKLPQLWQTQDTKRLAQYQFSITDINKIDLAPEPLAHLIYCESDWSH